MTEHIATIQMYVFSWREEGEVAIKLAKNVPTSRLVDRANLNELQSIFVHWERRSTRPRIEKWRKYFFYCLSFSTFSRWTSRRQLRPKNLKVNKVYLACFIYLKKHFGQLWLNFYYFRFFLFNFVHKSMANSKGK